MTIFTKFAQQFLDYQQQYVLSDQFIIGFSGGVDSTALLLCCAKLREQQPHLQFRAIYIHHGLSRHADQWALHCQQICANLKIPFILEKVQLATSQGIEAAAREARYLAIKQHIRSGETLLTAHHLQDQSETFLLALKRGSGILGLASMGVFSELYGMPILRPLLYFRRFDLERWVTKEQITWVEDESNQDNQYDRNFLRNDILPQLRQRWSYIDTAIMRSAMHCAEQQQLLEELLTKDFYQAYDPQQGRYSLQFFSNFSFIKQKALLRLWLKHQRISMPSEVQLTQIINDVIYARSDANPQFKLSQQILRRYQHYLYLTPHYNPGSTSSFIHFITIGESVPLPDNLGVLHCYLEQKEKALLFIWQKGEQQQQTRLPLPNNQTSITVQFTYSGKVKTALHSTNTDIKKVWQKMRVPPWERQRIPLIFYGKTLKSAVGFFKNFA